MNLRFLLFLLWRMANNRGIQIWIGVWVAGGWLAIRLIQIGVTPAFIIPLYGICAIIGGLVGFFFLPPREWGDWRG